MNDNLSEIISEFRDKLIELFAKHEDEHARIMHHACEGIIQMLGQDDLEKLHEYYRGVEEMSAKYAIQLLDEIKAGRAELNKMMPAEMKI